MCYPGYSQLVPSGQLVSLDPSVDATTGFHAVHTCAQVAAAAVTVVVCMGLGVVAEAVAIVSSASATCAAAVLPSGVKHTVRRCGDLPPHESLWLLG